MELGQNPLQRLRLPDGSGSIAAASWLQGAGVMGACDVRSRPKEKARKSWLRALVEESRCPGARAV